MEKQLLLTASLRQHQCLEIPCQCRYYATKQKLKCYMCTDKIIIDFVFRFASLYRMSKYFLNCISNQLIQSDVK